MLIGVLSFAQMETATVSGTVMDHSGAVVTDAQVQVTDSDTNVVTATTTNKLGVYVVPSLKPGRYRIAVTKVGFKQVVVTDVTLNVQDVVSRNFNLEVGAISESITVTADQLNVNTQDATVSTVVDQTFVKNMPLNGRSFQDLILLTPGTVTQTSQFSQNAASMGPGVGVTGEFSVNGQRTESNYYTVDGVSANVGASASPAATLGAGLSGSTAALTALGTTQALVSVDDLQEFRVQSSAYSAEYGRNPGGQFSFETKSGANQWHGTAYDYLRNNYFDANDWFNNYFGLKEPALRQNDFGGTFGGPVRIPRVYNGRDKTFFFVSYEGLRLTAPQPATVNLVPDLCLRGVAASCTGTSTPAPAALQPVLSAFPLPSPNGLDFGNGIGEYIGSWSNPASLDSTSVRFDHVVNDRLRFFFRFSDTASNSATRGTSDLGSTPTALTASPLTLRTYTVGTTSVFSNRLSNEFRLNYTSNQATSNSIIDSLGGSTPVNLAQLLAIGVGSEVAVTLCYEGCFGLEQFQQSGAQRQWNLVETASLSFGHHQFKFGVDYRRLAPFAVQANPQLDYIYSSESDVQTNSAQGFGATVTPAYPLYKNFSAFVQDQWRVSKRLDLSFGLRWEVNPAPGVTQGLKPYAIQGTGPDSWTLAPQGTPLWRTTWFNFAPRLGFAYILRNAPGHETVLRGGGGIFFDTGQQLGSLGFNGPGFGASACCPVISFPVLPAIPAIVNPPVAPFNVTPYVFAAHLQLPYTLQWNASIEQALGGAQAVSVSYVGSHATRLLQQNQFSTPTNPNAQTFIIVQNGLSSDYNALQAQFRRKLNKGLIALASYTWSHCLDYGSSNFIIGYQHGNCDFDVRNNVSTAFSYDLPSVGNDRLVKAVLGHWGLDDRFIARTAFPVTLRGFPELQPNGQLYDSGLDIIPDQPIYLYGANCASVLQSIGDLQPGQVCPGGRAINPNAFAFATSGLGDAPRNFARGFGAWQMNLAIRRDFPIREGLKLQFRAEAFNVFNHPNFGNISDIPFPQSTFGQATSTLASSLGLLSPLYQMGGPRSMQFAFKLAF